MTEEEEALSQTVKALQMTVPQELLHRDAEKKRVKKSLLEESGEVKSFEKTLYLPYLDFTYRYQARKGLFSKQMTAGNGRSVVMALREIDLGFYPELVAVVPQLTEVDPETLFIVEGVDSTILVQERLDDLKQVLSDYDGQLDELSKRYSAMPETDNAREDLKDAMVHLMKTKEERWKMFADGLKLPSVIDLESLELVDGSLFYVPYFIVRFMGDGESRFVVWDRKGKPDDSIAEELMKNGKFRDIILSHDMN